MRRRMSRPKTQDPRPKIQDSRPKIQDPRFKRPKTQDPRLKTRAAGRSRAFINIRAITNNNMCSFEMNLQPAKLMQAIVPVPRSRRGSAVGHDSSIKRGRAVLFTCTPPSSFQQPDSTLK